MKNKISKALRLLSKHKYLWKPLIFFIIYFALFIWIILSNININLAHINKNDIHNAINKAIDNDADIRAIKTIYKNQKSQKMSFFDLIKDKNGYYTENTTLSTILENIRTEMFLGDSINKVKLEKIDKLILEYTETNPYDSLELYQKEYFENIRDKLGMDYKIIEQDVNKIVDELTSKNDLVSKYLDKSNMSFIISIFAVILSILIGGYQIYNGRSKNIKKFFSEVLEEKGQG